MSTETMNIIAVMAGPIIAVAISLWHQERSWKRNEKIKLFNLLMANRKAIPLPPALVQGLNLIDVIYSEHRETVKLWHEYYDLLCQRPLNFQLMESKYLDLLASVAKALGYKDLQQTDIARFYTPEAHGMQAEINDQIQTEWLRVLKNSSSFGAPIPAEGRTEKNS